MTFLEAMEKQADWRSRATSVAKGAWREGKSLARAGVAGLRRGGDATIGSALKLKELGHIPAAVERAGGLEKSLRTRHGRARFLHGVAKAAPSLAAGTAYAVGAKKVYDKTLGGARTEEYNYGEYG